MNITWYGHAAFLVESNGLHIILDPYKSPDCGGYEAINDPADILSISHHNEKYHSCIAQVSGEYELVDAMKFAGGEKTVRGVTFRSVEVYEDDQGEGPNAMVSFEVEGLRITHLGDLGHQLSDEQLKAVSGTDILLALAGGPPTIKLDDLKTLIEMLEPRVTIPMHYKNEKIDLNIQPVEDFLALCPDNSFTRLDSSTVSITRENIEEIRPIVVLEPAR
tara:strand:+ start:150 stop:806 length:657 start_codon:yes stop_codon:yes gene_type:complete